MVFLALGGGPYTDGGCEVQLDGPLLVFEAAVLGGEELAAAFRSEDLPAYVAEIDRFPVDMERGDPLARLDRSLSDGHRAESVGAEALRELRPHGLSLVSKRMSSPRHSSSQDQIIQRAGKLRVHRRDLSSSAPPAGGRYA